MTPRPDIISVIIPHLNQEEQLRRCLISLQKQTGIKSAVEVVVVDNGSEKLPAALCKSFEGVRLEQEKTPGPGPARNKGVSVSNGAVIAFIDADCIADAGWIAAISSMLGDDGAHQILGGDVRIAISDPARLSVLEAYESIFAYRQQEYIERKGFSGTGNLAMRRECFDKVGPFGGIHLAEDVDWGRRANREGYSITYVPRMIVFHPARKTFKELCAKWDRHIDHSFEDFSQKRLGRLKWVFYAMAVAVSPLAETGRILTSSRVDTLRDKILAAQLLIRIRLYRAWHMFSRLLAGNQARGYKAWNRE